jgi:hypothetical protein
MTTTHPGSARTSLREWATGVTVFAAIMLMIGGILDIMRGIAEIAEDDIFASTRTYVAFDLTAWGWIHPTLGVLAFVVSFGLFMASTWARVIGVGIAGLVLPGLVDRDDRDLRDHHLGPLRDEKGRRVRPLRERPEGIRGVRLR